MKSVDEKRIKNKKKKKKDPCVREWNPTEG